MEPGGQLFSSEDEARVTVLHIIPAHHSLTSNKKRNKKAVLRIRIRCIFDPWIRDLGWVKNKDPDPG
jgi:hypothetical protein